MLHRILDVNNGSVPQQNNNEILRTDYSYEDELEKKASVAKEWAGLDAAGKQGYSNKIERFFAARGVIDVSSGEYVGVKYYSLVRNEVSARIERPDALQVLPISELHFEQALLELVENMENTSHIKSLYKARKLTVGGSKNAGINDEEASKLRNCLRQGRELYISGKHGSLLVKPLNFFYSMTAYAYAIIILNSPIRFKAASLPGSHGIEYIPDGFKVAFGGDKPHGTFSELVFSSPTIHVRNKNFAIVQDNTETLLAYFKKRHTVSIGCLLGMIPEIREYYRLINGSPGFTHPMDISLGSDPRNVKWEVMIGDGTVMPPQDEVERDFPGMKITSRHGKVVVEVPPAESHKIRAMIFVGVDGEFWYVQNPFHPVVLPEICIHFMLTSSFSNIMRYSPDHWGDILLNERSSDVSLMTRKYLSAFENKLPVLVLRSVSKFYPYIPQ